MASLDDLLFPPTPTAAPAAPEMGDIHRGFSQSLKELGGTGYGLVGLAGSALGADSVRDWGLENAQRKYAEAQGLAKPSDDLEGINSAGDALSYAKHGLGSLAGTVLPTLPLGGLGGALGKMLLGTTVKEAVESGVQKLTTAGIKSLTKDALDSAVERGVISAGEKAAITTMQTATRYGADVGVGAMFGGQGAASDYAELADQGVDDPGRAAAFGAAEGAVAMIPGAKIVKNLLEPELTGAIGARMLKGAASQAAIQAPAMAGMTAVHRAAVGQPLDDASARSAYMNSGVMGAMAGAMFGAAAGVRRPVDLMSRKPGTETPPEAGAPEGAPIPAAGEAAAEAPRMQQVETDPEKLAWGQYRDTESQYDALDQVDRTMQQGAQQADLAQWGRQREEGYVPPNGDMLGGLPEDQRGAPGVGPNPTASAVDVGPEPAIQQKQAEQAQLDATTNQQFAWRQAAANAYLKSVGDGSKFNPNFFRELLHTDTPEAAASMVRNLMQNGQASEKTVSAAGKKNATKPGSVDTTPGTPVFKSLDAVHQALTGMTLGDYFAAESTHNKVAGSNDHALANEGKTGEAPAPAEATLPSSPTGENTEQQVVTPSANEKTREGLNNMREKMVKDAVMEDAGRASLDDLEEAGGSPAAVAKEFWSKTYFALPARAQDKFRQMLKEHSGGRSDSLDQVKNLDLPDVVEHLEGTERGFVALMHEANNRFSEAKQATPPAPKALGEALAVVPEKKATPKAKAAPNAALLEGEIARLNDIVKTAPAGASSDAIVQRVRSALNGNPTTVKAAQKVLGTKARNLDKLAADYVGMAKLAGESAKREEGNKAADKPVTKEVKAQAVEFWGANDRTEGDKHDVAFPDLSAERKQMWYEAQAENRATAELHDQLADAQRKETPHGEASVSKEEDAINPHDYREQPNGVALAPEAVARVKAGDLTGALQHIADNSTSKFAREVAKRLISLKLTTEIEHQDSEYLNDEKKQVGGYTSGDRVVLSNRGLTEDALLHETTHGAVIYVLEHPKTDAQRRAVQELKGLYARAKLEAYADGTTARRYGLKNIHEFVAEAMSNRDFQSWLMQITHPSSKTETLWTHFTRTVAKLLGMDNVLGQTAAWTEHLMALPPEHVADRFGQFPGQSRYGTSALMRGESSFGKNEIGLSVAGTVGEVVGRVESIVKDAIGNRSTDWKTADTKATRLGLAWRSLSQIAYKFTRDLPAVTAYAHASKEQDSIATQAMARSSKVQETWVSLPKAAREQVGALMRDARDSAIHPDRDFRDADVHAHLKPEQEHQWQDLHDRYNALSETQRKVFDGARDELAKQWSDQRAAMRTITDSTYDRLVESAREAGNMRRVEELQNERRLDTDHLDKIFATREGPYFPSSRFGEHVVIYKSPELHAAEAKHQQVLEHFAEFHKEDEGLKEVKAAQGKAVSAHRAFVAAVKAGKSQATLVTLKAARDDARAESRQAKLDNATSHTKAQELYKQKADSLKAVNDLRANGKHYSVEAFENEFKAGRRFVELSKKLGKDNVERKTGEDYHREISAVNQPLVDKIVNTLTSGMPEKLVSEARAAAQQLVYQMAPAQSALRRRIKREGIAGASPDMLRSFASVSAANAFYLAHLTRAPDAASALYNLREQANRGAGDKATKTDVYNEVARRHVLGMQYATDSPWMARMAGLTFAYKLGLSPGFMMMQATQTPMLTLPMLAGRHGFIKAGKALAAALGDTARLMKSSIIESQDERGMASGLMRFELNIDKHKEQVQGERQMLNTLFNHGLINITLPNDLRAVAHGSDLGLRTVANVLSWAPQQLEVMNRVVSSLAAYRLRRAEGDSHARAVEYAERAVDNTHFDYTTANTPYAMRASGLGGASRLIFQFKKFSQGAIYLWMHNLKDAFFRPGATPEEKSAARTTVWGLLVTHTLLAGALGIPAAAPLGKLASLVNALFGSDDDGKPFDPEVSFRNYLTDAVGVDAARAIAKGIPAMLGMDMSKRVGIGDVLDPLAFMRSGKKGRDAVAEGFLTLAGPFAGMVADAGDALNLIAKGDTMKGAEKLMPKVVSDVAKAARYGSEGMTTSKGDVTIKSGDFAWSTLVAQGLGLSPTAVSDYFESKNAVDEQVRGVADKRTQLINDAVKARKAGDDDALAQAKDAITRFNARNADPATRITGSTILQAMQAHRKFEREVNAQHLHAGKRERSYMNEARFNAEE